MKKILFILCGLLFLSFSVKAEFGMILGHPGSGVVYLFNTETGWFGAVVQKPVIESLLI